MTVAGPITTPAVRPSGWWYALPAAGLLVAAVVGIQILRDGWRDAQRVVPEANVVAPGDEQLLTINEPGGYTIGIVGAELLDADEDKERLAEELALEVVPAEGGDPLPLAVYEGFREMSRPVDGAQYVPLRTVRFVEAGDYVLRSRHQPGLDPARTVLVVTQSPFRKVAAALRAAVLLQVVAVFLAILVTVILARTRGRSRRAIRAAAPPPPPWSGPPPWAGPPGGGWPPR